MATHGSGRRSFFRFFARDLLVEAEELRGIRHVTYGELLSASDEKLGGLVPVIRQGITIISGERQVLAKMPDGAEQPLFEITEIALLIFNFFNGQNTLNEVGRMVSSAMNWPEEQGFHAARGLFLKLVCAGVAGSCCHWT
jgi:hypothetical protein